MISHLERAEMVAKWAHRGQTDMANKPYEDHCQRVVDNLVRAGVTDQVTLAVAWLHDVVEDTRITIQDLYDLGFSEAIVKGVDAMTQRPHEELTYYWERVKGNWDAWVVKYHGDIPDNTAAWRLEYLPEHTQIKLVGKYHRATQFLGDPFVDAKTPDGY